MEVIVISQFYCILLFWVILQHIFTFSEKVKKRMTAYRESTLLFKINK